MDVFCKSRGMLRLAVLAALYLGFNAQVAWPAESGAFPGKDTPVVRGGQGFHGVGLGHSVAASEPIDIERDGVWEFAIKTDDIPPSYGVYSYAKGVWIDGPRELPRIRGAWSANDYDGDGLVEYAHQWKDTIKLYDPGTDTDSILWLQSTAGNPRTIFWGSDATGRFLLAEVRSLSNEYGFVAISSVVVRDLLTGERKLTLDSVIVSSSDASALIPDFPRVGQIGRVLVYESVYCGVSSPTYCNTLVQLRAIGPDWQTEAAADFARGSSLYSGGLKDGYWGIESAIIPGSDPDPARFVSLGLPINYQYMSAELCSYGGPVAKTCASFAPEWDYTKGIWIHDVGDDGTPDLVIPRKDNGGWELRDPYDLTERGVIANMPSVRVNTGPVETAGQYDMFYFEDDSLYVWGPVAKRGGERGTTNIKLRQLGSTPNSDKTATGADVASLPKSFTLHAYPNPFNSSVRLTWPAQDQSARIEILNVLGQQVRGIDIADGGSSVEWDAHSDAGQQVPSGVYFARLIGQRATATVMLVLLK